MREKRLLERLRAIEDQPDWRGESDPKTAIASVLEHLSKILNTRQGSALIAADLGMPDFTSFSGSMSADSLPEMAETLAKVITEYEPRLNGVRVDVVPHEEKAFTIAFKLTANICVENRAVPLVFETVLNSDGRITVVE